MSNPGQQQAQQRREPDAASQTGEDGKTRGRDIEDDELERGPEGIVEVVEGVHEEE